MLKYQYCTHNGLDSDLIEVQLVQRVYGFVIETLKQMQMLPKGSFKVDLNHEADISLVNLFYSDCKFNSNRNYYEMFILANGSLFMSEALLS